MKTIVVQTAFAKTTSRKQIAIHRMVRKPLSHVDNKRLLRLTLAEPMKDASEDEDEDTFVPTTKSEAEPGKSRSEREERLRKLMDEEGE